MDFGNLNAAWNTITIILRRPNDESVVVPNREQFSSAIAVLHQHGMSHIIREWFLASFKEDMQDHIVPEFWKRFNNFEAGSFFKFPEVLGFLTTTLESYFPAIDELQTLQDNLTMQMHTLPPEGQKSLLECKKPIKEEFLFIARCLLFANWPVDFRAVVMDIFTKAFKAWLTKCQNARGSSDVDCVNCKSGLNNCVCASHLDAFYNFIQNLNKLNFFQTVAGDVPINVAQDIVEKHVKEFCRGNFEAPLLKPLQDWVEENIVCWLKSFYNAENTTDGHEEITEYQKRLMNILYEAFTHTRMDQLFDIIIEYPESKAALEDLKEVLKITNLRSKLMMRLKSSLQSRLLHPGVNTGDILTAYISAIKALIVLDSTGVILQVVSEPVCEYLRSREDTVRCIIFSLREDSCGELACELLKGMPMKLEASYPCEETTEEWQNWCPDPVDADPSKSTETQRSSDIIGILVNIYGSKELFVNEYRSLLADRILTTFSYNADQELRYLEMLKLRFGESQLHYCEVMLKDIADSKRLNSNITSGELKTYEQGDFPINTMILSAQFWPSFKEENLKLPEHIWTNLKKFTTAFESLKGNRTLVWKTHLGSVEVDIEMKGRTVTLKTSPIHVTILWHFQEKPKWTITELSTEMQLSASVLRRKITFWQSHGILQEIETDVFILLEEQRTPSRDSIVMVEEERESVTASSQDMKEEELQTFWSFIVGMLTNMESLPLERIHSMLRMFAVQGSSTSECSIQDMKQFLEKKVRDRQLVYTAGMFKLPKFDP
ncbi:hypothetical protein JTE90_028026 [Oedothorax gibbosus]|uniref:Anaphase-promoting complex subunit 2 n=1 Tax=Oedothorax gibbosus TaxID=931172 RepID=A0AAV6VDE1_9ARAC|nr:hypothetical protein JTE90_028026 [Oedothorax gibbosus]